TTSPVPTPIGQAGELGQPGTQILFGGERVGDDARSGFGLDFERALDPCGTRTFGVGAIVLPESSANFFADTNTYPILAVPFFNAGLAQEDASVVGFPGSRTGFVDIRDRQSVYGADLYLKRLIYAECGTEVRLVTGYRFFQLNNQLNLTQFADAFLVATQITQVDNFETENQFHGGTLGLEMNRQVDCWTFNALARLHLGNMNQRVDINGSTTTVVGAGAPNVVNQGLFAWPTNSGLHERNRFATVPELELSATRRLNSCWEASLGYTFIYWSDVVYAGDQIDRRINAANLPAFNFNSTSDWVSGLNITLTGTY
ncbi:MAG: BBP7 family outer membrane beta-barrel protein, partial [Planctomycetales bacterium]|nr:BBP7 family outer membrane beta-barrel protein [Planctomycetales bacterium]